MKRLFVLAFVALFAGAGASARNLAEILQSPTRPNMSQVRPMLDDISESAGVPVSAQDVANYFDRRINIPGWLPRLLSNGPKMIAHFEKTYPGATWVFLGRDGLPWADLFEAYYSSLGQEGRVIRLGVSKPSMNADDETFIKLMRSHGIPVDSLDESHPVIFIDSVSSGFGRQGRRLMSALYANWVKSGKDPLLLLDKVDMIGLIVSTFGGTPNDMQFKPFHQYLQALLLLDCERNGCREIDGHLRVLTYAQEPNHANEAGYTHFLGAWHDSFQEIRYNRSSGKWEAEPGDQYPEPMKRSVLWTQKQIWNNVLSGECDRNVQAWAQRLGFRFSVARPAPAKPDRQKIAKFREKLTRRQSVAAAENLNHHAAWSADLRATLATLPANAGDRYNLIRVFEQQQASLQNYEWTAKAAPKTILSDVQFLQKALKTDCAKLLEAGR